MIEITGLTDGDCKAVLHNTKLDLMREGLVCEKWSHAQLKRLGQVVALNMGTQYSVTDIEPLGPGHVRVLLKRADSDVSVTFMLDFMKA